VFYTISKLREEREIKMKMTKLELLEVIESIKWDYANWRKLNLAYVELGDMSQDDFDKQDKEYKEEMNIRITRLEEEMYL